MKNLSASRPSGSPRRRGLMLLGSALCALTITLSTFAAPALAATTSPGTAKPTSSTSLDEIDHVALSTTVTTSQSTATNRCSTVTTSQNGSDLAGLTLVWIKMQTTWCYNYRVVYSHSTVLSWGVTTPGALAGWQVLGGASHAPDYSFNCYVAAGAPGGGGCSGNHEYMKQYFITRDFPGYGEADLTINQEENYKGQAWGQGTEQFCPGGC